MNTLSKYLKKHTKKKKPIIKKLYNKKFKQFEKRI